MHIETLLKENACNSIHNNIGDKIFAFCNLILVQERSLWTIVLFC